jgi:hypothetical protein
MRSVTNKFRNLLYYSNTTNAIYQGEWDWLESTGHINSYDMQISTSLVDTYED